MYHHRKAAIVKRVAEKIVIEAVHAALYALIAPSLDALAAG
jgi:hypothetical protein